MPKITVVQEGAALQELCQISVEELAILVEKLEKENPEIGFRTLIPVCQDKPFVLRKDAMPEIIALWIVRNSRLIPVVSITQADSAIPWRISLPKRAPEGSIRVSPDSPFMGYDAGKKGYFMFSTGSPVDIRGFRIPGKAFSISDLTSIFSRIIAEGEFVKTQAHLALIHREKEAISQYIPLVAEKKVSFPFIEAILKYMNLQGDFPSSSVVYAVSPYREIISYVLGEGPGATMRHVKERKERSKINSRIASGRSMEILTFSFLRALLKRKGMKIKGNSSSSLFQMMNEKERGDAKAELEAYLSYINAVRSSKCKHLPALLQFNDAVKLVHKKRNLRSLMEFAANPKDREGMITCRDCSLPMICPHTVASFALPSPARIREALEKYSDTTQNEESGALCRICNEDLFTYDYDDSFEEYYADVYSPLNRYMWSSSMVIYGTMKFRPPLDAKTFAIQATKTALGALMSSEFGPVKNAMEVFHRTGDINFEVQFYCLLFIYAFILCVMRRNSTDEGTSGLVQLSFQEAKKGQSDISSAAGIVLARFEGMHSYIFSSVRKEGILAEFKAIYGEMIRYAPTARFVSYVDPGVSVIASIMECSTFKYIMLMLGASGETFHDIREIFSRIFGLDIEEVVKKATEGGAIFRGTKVLPLRTQEGNEGFQRRKEIFSLYLKRVGGEDINFDKYPSSVFGRGISRPFMYIYGPFKGSVPVLYPAEISGIYDENGKDHVWSKKRSGTGALGPIIDLECTVCKISRSSTSKLDEKKCRKGREKEEMIRMLYSLFSRYCPEGGLHSFVKGACSRCGFASGSRSDAFISKYISRVTPAVQKPFRIEMRAPKKRKDKDKGSKTEKGSDPAKILEVARIGGVTNAFIEAIGLMLGLEYDEVLSGKSHHPVPTSRYSLVISTVIGYIRAIPYFFNLLRGASSAPRDLAFDIFKVLSDADYPSSAWPRLSRLPNFYDSYIEEIEGIRDDTSRTGGELYSFLINTLCTMLLDQGSSIPGEFKKVLLHFTNRMIYHIISSESHTCKAGSFDKALFARRKEEAFIPAPLDINPDITLETFEKTKGEGVDYNGYNDVDGD